MERAEAAGKSSGLTERPAPAEETDALPLCSVVIPTYNGRELLDRCLASIARHRPADRDRSIEVIVSDDGSNDGTAEWLASAYSEVRLVRVERNQGFCAAANRGIAMARGRFIQLLNNDTEVGAGWIEAGLAPFADATVGSVAPLVLVRSEPGRVDSAGRFVRPTRLANQTRTWPAGARFAARPVEEVFGASGSSAFYRRRGPSHRRRIRPALRLLLRGHGSRLSLALGWLSLPVRSRMLDLSRRFRDL